MNLHTPTYLIMSGEKIWVVYTVYTPIYDTMWLQRKPTRRCSKPGSPREVPNLALQFLFSNFEHKQSRFVNGCKVPIVNFVFCHFVEDYNRNQSNKKQSTKIILTAPLIKKNVCIFCRPKSTTQQISPKH